MAGGDGLARSSLLRSATRWLSRLLAAYGLSILVVFYSPFTDYLVRPLWVPPDVTPAPVIVALAAYVSRDGVLSDAAMRRTHTASRLYRDSLSKVLIISGGDPTRATDRQPADSMAQFAREFGVPARAILLEKASEDTHTSALNVAALCRQRGIERVLLVTDAIHMRRAVGAFRAQGVEVSPVPADPWALHWETPDIRLRRFWAALHEYGGLLYYWWKGWI